MNPEPNSWVHTAATVNSFHMAHATTPVGNSVTILLAKKAQTQPRQEPHTPKAPEFCRVVLSEIHAMGVCFRREKELSQLKPQPFIPSGIRLYKELKRLAPWIIIPGRDTWKKVWSAALLKKSQPLTWKIMSQAFLTGNRQGLESTYSGCGMCPEIRLTHTHRYFT